MTPDERAHYVALAERLEAYAKSIVHFTPMVTIDILEAAQFLRDHVEPLKTGASPQIGYCRICGRRTIPPYPGYYRDAVCSDACFTEWEWRDTLRILRKPYYPDPRPNPRQPDGKG